MAHQDEGWPLRLQPLNARIGLMMMRNQDSYGSVSFNTLLTASPISSTTVSSSDLDTESTGSFFQDKSMTLGSLIGVSSIIELSRRSTRGIRTTETLTRNNKKNPKCKPSWLLSLCSKLTTDAVVFSSKQHPPSLAHFLEAEKIICYHSYKELSNSSFAQY